MTETYFTGVPCKRGHAAPRYVSNGSCVKCIRVKNRTYRSLTVGSQKTREYAKLYYAKNRTKKLAQNRAWQKDNPEKMRAYRKEYAKLNKHVAKGSHRRQRGYPAPTRLEPALCECCGKKPERRSLNLDHCHATGVFRGWLCQRCNTGLGLLGDTIESLGHAVRYLERVRG